MDQFFNKDNLPKGSVTIKKGKKVPFFKTVNAKQYLKGKPDSTDLLGMAPGRMYGWLQGAGTEHTFTDKAGFEVTVFLEYKRPYYLPYEKTTGLYIPIYGKTVQETLECLSRMEFKHAMESNRKIAEALSEFKHYMEEPT